jgi:hypothetical protein
VNIRSRVFFSGRHLWHSEYVSLFSRVWQTFSCSQQYILRGVLVEQPLENKPTAHLGWNPFGDVAPQRTPVTSAQAADVERKKGTALPSSIFFSKQHVSWIITKYQSPLQERYDRKAFVITSVRYLSRPFLPFPPRVEWPRYSLCAIPSSV